MYWNFTLFYFSHSWGKNSSTTTLLAPWYFESCFWGVFTFPQWPKLGSKVGDFLAFGDLASPTSEEQLICISLRFSRGIKMISFFFWETYFGIIFLFQIFFVFGGNLMLASHETACCLECLLVFLQIFLVAFLSLAWYLIYFLKFSLSWRKLSAATSNAKASQQHPHYFSSLSLDHAIIFISETDVIFQNFFYSFFDTT